MPAFRSLLFAPPSKPATSHTRKWMRLLSGRVRVPAPPMLALDEAFKRPQVAARLMLFRNTEGNLHIGNPINFRNEPARINAHLPDSGRHTNALMQEIRARRARAR